MASNPEDYPEILDTGVVSIECELDPEIPGLGCGVIKLNRAAYVALIEAPGPLVCPRCGGPVRLTA